MADGANPVVMMLRIQGYEGRSVKSKILLIFVAILAIAVGLSSVASARVEGGSAATSAKKKAKKKCKGKKKAGKSAAASAKKKAKKKCKKSKGKGKGGGKGTATPDEPPPPAASNWPPPAGTYRDHDHDVSLEVKAGGTRVNVWIEGNGTCIPIPIPLGEVDATVTATNLTAHGSFYSAFGFGGTWKIDVQSNHGYKLEVDSEFKPEEGTPCNKPGVVINGTFPLPG